MNSGRQKKQAEDRQARSLRGKSADRPASQPGRAARHQNPAGQELLALWQDEVEGLSTTEFESYEAAVYAIIDGVLQKLESNASGQEETRKFLYEMLTSDPAIEGEIRDILRIK